MSASVERIDHVADRLRHLLAPVEQEAVAEDALGQRQLRRHQEGRPIDRVEADDILADDVHIRRPVMPARIVLVREAAAGHVIVERIDPHIHDVLRCARHRQAPVEGRTADREILQAGAHEADDLVAPRLRADEIRVRLVMRQQTVLIGGEAEEIALLLDPFDRRAGGRAPVAVGLLRQLALVVIGLVPDRVPAGIFGRGRCPPSPASAARAPGSRAGGRHPWCG